MIKYRIRAKHRRNTQAQWTYWTNSAARRRTRRRWTIGGKRLIAMIRRRSRDAERDAAFDRFMYKFTLAHAQQHADAIERLMAVGGTGQAVTHTSTGQTHIMKSAADGKTLFVLAEASMQDPTKDGATADTAVTPTRLLVHAADLPRALRLIAATRPRVEL